MSITCLSSKRFTQKSLYKFTLYRTSVIILTLPPLYTHIHSIVKLCGKGVSQTKREAFFKKMCFQIFLERGERDGELRTFVGRELQILAAWKWKDLFPADLRLGLGTFVDVKHPHPTTAEKSNNKKKSKIHLHCPATAKWTDRQVCLSGYSIHGHDIKNDYHLCLGSTERNTTYSGRWQPAPGASGMEHWSKCSASQDSTLDRQRSCAA